MLVSSCIAPDTEWLQVHFQKIDLLKPGRASTKTAQQQSSGTQWQGAHVFQTDMAVKVNRSKNTCNGRSWNAELERNHSGSNIHNLLLHRSKMSFIYHFKGRLKYQEKIKREFEKNKKTVEIRDYANKRNFRLSFCRFTRAQNPTKADPSPSNIQSSETNRIIYIRYGTIAQGRDF